MHIGEGEAASGASACSNATITNNDIGPCGLEGHDAAGHGQWADGISFACTNSLVQSNTVCHLMLPCNVAEPWIPELITMNRSPEALMEELFYSVALATRFCLIKL